MKKAAAVLAIALALTFGLIIAALAQEKAPGIVVLKGNPLGGVKFNHTTHAKLVGDKCETCHHASKAEKPLKSKNENCTDCHTKTATAPMKTTIKLAFHDNLSKTGTCPDCHIKQSAAGNKKVPLKCTDCHKKENV